jgi:SAM-dependent methyltransferase
MKAAAAVRAVSPRTGGHLRARLRWRTGAGFAVDAVDSYRAYEGAFAGPTRVLAESGVSLIDFADVGYGLAGMDARYDIVLCMGVIEHVPSSPRPLLETLDRVLARGGLLVLDTPNLVHLYNRQNFARGDTVLADIQAQFETELPFEATIASTRSPSWYGCCATPSARSRRAMSTTTRTWSAIRRCGNAS